MFHLTFSTPINDSRRATRLLLFQSPTDPSSSKKAAEAMKISKAQLSDLIRQTKGVSANLALRVQFCFGIPGDLLIRLQAQFDYQKAFHAKNGDLQTEVRAIA